MSESTRGEVIFYESPQGKVRVEVHHEDETFWLSQRQMAELFGVEVPTVIHHLKEIFDSGELVQAATTRKLRVVRTEGNRSVSREIAHYNLDAIISVGYRVNSTHATPPALLRTPIERRAARGRLRAGSQMSMPRASRGTRGEPFPPP